MLLQPLHCAVNQSCHTNRADSFIKDNFRIMCPIIAPVSYTHLDVYKRQVVFRMALHEDLPAIAAHDQEQSRLVGLCQNDQFRMLLHILPADLRIAGMRRHDIIVHAPHQWNPVMKHLVAVDATELALS